MGEEVGRCIKHAEKIRLLWRMKGLLGDQSKTMDKTMFAHPSFQRLPPALQSSLSSLKDKLDLANDYMSPVPPATPSPTVTAAGSPHFPLDSWQNLTWRKHRNLCSLPRQLLRLHSQGLPNAHTANQTPRAALHRDHRTKYILCFIHPSVFFFFL